MTAPTHPKIGLALGSGGSRGLAHIGVIKALEEHHIPIDIIAGSSIGAMIGGFYASGLSVEDMEGIVSETNWKKMASLVDPHLKEGLIGGEKVKLFIEELVGGKQIEDCIIPFAAVATDLDTGNVVDLRTGDLAQAIRASISIPLVFKPVDMGGMRLADGGLSAPVPVEIARSMGADIVIAINLDKHYHAETKGPAWYGVAEDSLDILRHHLARANVATADISIDIDVGKSYWYQFTNGQEKILTGEKAVIDILPRLRELIRQKGEGRFGKFLHLFGT